MGPLRTILAGLSITWAGAALADPESGDAGWHGPHMMAWPGWHTGPLMMVVFGALLAAAVLLIVRLVRGGGGRDAARRSPSDRSVEILRERFARGEIDQQEFDQRRRALGE